MSIISAGAVGGEICRIRGDRKAGTRGIDPLDDSRPGHLVPRPNGRSIRVDRPRRRKFARASLIEQLRALGISFIGRRLGVLGYGEVGSATGRALRGLGE